MSEALDDQGSLDAHASDWSLIRCIGEGILVLSAKDYRIVAASQAFLQEMKLTRDRLLGKTCQEAKACCAFPCEMEEGFALALRTAQSRCKEVEEHSHYDGSQLTKSVEVTSYPLLDAAGNLTEIMVIERDVTARKRIENELKNAVYELSILGEVTSALQSTMEMEEVLHRFLVAVTAGESLGFNRAFILLVDEEARELKGHMAVGPSSPEEAGRMWQELNQKNLPLAELLTSSHERSKNRDTAVNQAARNLRIRLDEKDHVFIRALDQKLSINVLHGRMEGADSLPVHEELLRLLGTDCFAVVPLHFKEKRIGVLVADNFINRRPIGREDIKFLETFAYQASSAIENSQLYKELREKLVVCQLTNQSLIENQEKLLEAERLAAVGKMAAALAHEIRNPLVSIGGFARSLLKDLNAQDPRHEPLSIISSEVQRLESIVNEVLGYARLRKPTMAHGDLNELLRHSLEVVGGALERQEIEVQLETDPALPPVRMDESQMPQVLINILLNAIQAMPDGGTLRVRSLQCDPFVEIQVSDTGCGIPREIQDRLFQAFFTTKPTGSGLGLTVASQIIHQHRGSITVESEIGKGSTFTIRLPLTWTEEEAKAS